MSLTETSSCSFRNRNLSSDCHIIDIRCSCVDSKGVGSGRIGLSEEKWVRRFVHYFWCLEEGFLGAAESY